MRTLTPPEQLALIADLREHYPVLTRNELEFLYATAELAVVPREYVSNLTTLTRAAFLLGLEMAIKAWPGFRELWPMISEQGWIVHSEVNRLLDSMDWDE